MPGVRALMRVGAPAMPLTAALGAVAIYPICLLPRSHESLRREVWVHIMVAALILHDFERNAPAFAHLASRSPGRSPCELAPAFSEAPGKQPCDS